VRPLRQKLNHRDRREGTKSTEGAGSAKGVGSWQGVDTHSGPPLADHPSLLRKEGLKKLMGSGNQVQEPGTKGAEAGRA